MLGEIVLYTAILAGLICCLAAIYTWCMNDFNQWEERNK